MSDTSKATDETDDTLTDYINQVYYPGLSTNLIHTDGEEVDDQGSREKGKKAGQGSEPRSVRWWEKK